MAGVVSTWLTAMRLALKAAPASLIMVPATLDVDDLPDGGIHQTFSLTIADGLRYGNTFGGGSLVEYTSTAKLEIRWDPQLDSEAIANTIADDMENASAVMLKNSNKTAGIVLVLPASNLVIANVSTNQISAVGTYSVRFRVAQDLS